MTSDDEKDLYDRFVKTLPKDDAESSSRWNVNVCPPGLNSASSDPSGSVSGSVSSSVSGSGSTHSNSIHTSEGDEDSVQPATPEEIERFLNKIYEPVDPSKVQGFDHDLMSLKMLLLDPTSPSRPPAAELKLIGVVGMLGVGKTTLCRLIMDDQQVKQQFVPRIRVSMSDVEPMEKLVERMLEHLGVEQEEISTDSNNIPTDQKLQVLLYALHLRLKGKKYLIVLDGIAGEQDKYYPCLKTCLHDGHGFPKGSGGAVILSTRNEEAIEKMELVKEQNMHRLLPLKNPEMCWQIYQSLASASDIEQSSDSNVPGVKEELTNKCGGLPLAARIMGEFKRRELSTPASKDQDI